MLTRDAVIVSELQLINTVASWRLSNVINICSLFHSVMSGTRTQNTALEIAGRQTTVMHCKLAHQLNIMLFVDVRLREERTQVYLIAIPAILSHVVFNSLFGIRQFNRFKVVNTRGGGGALA